MKRHIIFFLTILTIFTYRAQSQDSYLGFSLGTSIPRSDFSASEDLFSNGYAIPGFTVSFEGIYFPLPVIGVGGVLGFGSLYANSDVYQEDLIDFAYSQSEIPMFGSPPTQDDFGLESGFWNYVNLLVGPELSIPFGRFQAGIRGQAGFTFAFYPTREFYYSEGSNTLDILAKGSSASFAYSYGGSLLYKSRSGTGVKISADYLSTKVSYDLDMDVVNNNVDYNLTRPGNIDIDALSLTLGFFYSF
ncbi:MAG TPA: hypothetical protein DEQ09_11800 [Bacteroidales bacterium]|nr:hypothetical protein [Bacteroidales bacterium]